MMKLGEVAYKDQNANADNGNNDVNPKDDNSSKNTDEVVDADFEEVKSEDDKKNAS